MWQEFLSEIDNYAGTNRKNWLIIDLLAALIGGSVAFIEGHVWSPAGAYFTVIAMVIADFVTAIIYAYKRGKFETRKAMRLVYKIVAYTVLLSLTYNLAKFDKLLIWLPEAVFLPMVLILLASIVKNLSLLGLIPNKLAERIYDKIDTYKNDEQPKQ